MSQQSSEATDGSAETLRRAIFSDTSVEKSPSDEPTGSPVVVFRPPAL